MKTICAILVTALFLATLPNKAMAQTPHNFVYFRGGSASSILVFYTYDFLAPKIIAGSPMLVISGMLDPHGSEYNEYDIGVGINASSSSMVVIPFALIAFTADKVTNDLYAQAGAYLQVNKGKASASAFLFQYVPVQNSGVFQTLIDPANAMYRFHKTISCGMSYTLTKIEGLPTRHAIGPSIQIFIPRTGDDSLTMDFFKGIDNYADEIRLTLQATF